MAQIHSLYQPTDTNSKFPIRALFQLLSFFPSFSKNRDTQHQFVHCNRHQRFKAFRKRSAAARCARASLSITDNRRRGSAVRLLLLHGSQPSTAPCSILQSPLFRECEGQFRLQRRLISTVNLIPNS